MQETLFAIVMILIITIAAYIAGKKSNKKLQCAFFTIFALLVAVIFAKHMLMFAIPDRPITVDFVVYLEWICWAWMSFVMGVLMKNK